MITSIDLATPRPGRIAGRARHHALAAAVLAAVMAAVAPTAIAHAPGTGPAAMGGCGDFGMGPGMMGGYGMGPGMMGGYGMGPGMMGGYGMGPGMMGGYGMGPGMTGGYGMGPGMMGYGDGRHGAMHGASRGPGAVAQLDLTDEQRSRIAKIRRDLRSRQLKLMGELHEQYERRAEATDDDVASRADDQIVALRQQMLGNANAARKDMIAVLTKEQRRQLWRGGF